VKDYIKVLELAAQNALPSQIDRNSDPEVTLVRELIEAGYL
jgi:hypothetical protein